MRFAKTVFLLLTAVLILSLPPAVFAGETLDTVKARGYLIVGVNGGLYGFAIPDEKGVWRGLDVDTGRAIAVAIFGDPDKIKYVTLTTQTRFTALQSKEPRHWRCCSSRIRRFAPINPNRQPKLRRRASLLPLPNRQVAAPARPTALVRRLRRTAQQLRLPVIRRLLREAPAQPTARPPVMRAPPEAPALHMARARRPGRTARPVLPAVIHPTWRAMQALPAADTACRRPTAIPPCRPLMVRLPGGRMGESPGSTTTDAAWTFTTESTEAGM